MEHAWCRDVARDEQVRAAEDGRDRPLPTLEEAIAAVTESMSKDAKGEGMEQGNFAEAAKCSSPVSKTCEGQSGMRTERITLEVTHKAACSAREWRMWRTIFDPKYGESVRVVEEAHFDDLAQVAMERDAAIRELSAEKMWRDNLAMQRNEIRDERDALRARVASLEAASGGGGPVAWGVRTHDGRFVCASSKSFMESEAEQQRGTLHPLYSAPPQPRGWLTPKDREWLIYINQNVRLPGGAHPWLKSFLARSSPPEVVLPENPYHPSGLREGFDHAIRIVRNELVNAGVIKDATK